jgi:hypothetical protein
MYTRGNSHEESDPDCIVIPHPAIFRYDGEDIGGGGHILEKIGSISVARSSGTGL